MDLHHEARLREWARVPHALQDLPRQGLQRQEHHPLRFQVWPLQQGLRLPAEGLELA